MIRAIEINLDPDVIAATVTAASHPRLFAALTIVAHDCGAGAGRTSYGIPPEWVQHLSASEAALAKLSDDDLETFCIGEEGDQMAIAERDVPALAIAAALLTAFFDGWPSGEEDNDS